MRLPCRRDAPSSLARRTQGLPLLRASANMHRTPRLGICTLHVRARGNVMTHSATKSQGDDRTPLRRDAARQRLIDEIERLTQEVMWRGRVQFAERLSAFGLTVPQYFALHMIERLGPDVTMGEIAEAIQAPASSITSIVDRLERDGFVERRPHPADRRSVVACLTPAGANIVRKVEAMRHRDLVATLAEMDTADLERFVALLARILAGIESR